MEASAELLIGIVIAIYGGVVLSKRKTTIPFGGSGVWHRKPLFYLRPSGITAVIFAAGLIFGGIAIAFPSAYEILSSQRLQNDLALWIPLIGIGLIVAGIVAATVSGMLRTAKSLGDKMYIQNKITKPLSQRDDETEQL